MLNCKWNCIAVLLAVICVQSECFAQFGGLFRSAPSVKEVSTQQLHRMMTAQADAENAAKQAGQRSPKPKFIVVDVRTPEEYGVSMIPGAITKQPYEQNPKAYEGRTAIPYCTVGGRSLKCSQQLAVKGVKVENDKGSILKWIDSGLPLVTLKGEPTNRVHTYSDRYRVPAQYEQVSR